MHGETKMINVLGVNLMEPHTLGDNFFYKKKIDEWAIRTLAIYLRKNILTSSLFKQGKFNT